jgi:hypothetical protein
MAMKVFEGLAVFRQHIKVVQGCYKFPPQGQENSLFTDKVLHLDSGMCTIFSEENEETQGVG